jgi:SAM-dependent methyltransferase
VDGHTYLKCPECGLIYVDDIADWDVLYRAYDGGFWKSLRRSLVLPFRRFRHCRDFGKSMDRARGIIEFIRSRGIDESAGIDLLDVGCNKGFLLAAAIEQSWDVAGVEVVPELLVPFRREYPRYADRIISGKLDDARSVLDEEKFDVITAIDVLEHFEDPAATLGMIHSMLEPGGIFVIQTPDTACAPAPGDGPRWGALKPLEHLQLFNSANLALAARQAGFEEPDFYPPFEEADGNLVAVLRKTG